MPFSLISLTRITYRSFSIYWIMFELRIFQTVLKNPQTVSSFKALPLA